MMPDVTAIMRKTLFFAILLLPMVLLAADINLGSSESSSRASSVKTVSSPPNRVALLELYTSEGCSSCPPADQFLSNLKASGVSDRQLIPIAFHVTYWDYIGWKDRFAKKQYDQRQRDLALKKSLSTVYTPQFLLSGSDYRRYANFSEDVNKLASQKAFVDLTMSARIDRDSIGGEILQLAVTSDISKSEIKGVDIYVVVLEDNLVSEVGEGENEGKQLHHDSVVRQMSGPHSQTASAEKYDYKQSIELQPEWKKHDLSIVVFAENSKTGEVLQAIRLGEF